MDPRVVFLPGVVGDPDFWLPVAERLPAAWEKVLLDWPGAGDLPPDPGVRGFDDLVARTAAALGPAGDLVAQSMGGAVAIRLAVEFPGRVRRLVLTATSGGVDVAGLGADDWRPEYRTAYPDAARWISDPQPDQTAMLGAITAPTLLLWGDDDPISPVAVGRRLAELLPDATLHVIPGATHELAREYPQEVCGLIAAHFGVSAA